MKNILVLSPHYDDAALSCADYLLNEKKSGSNILVLNIFTKYNQTIKNTEIKQHLASIGFTSQKLKTYGNCRANEDYSAMKRLGFTSKALDFVDGGFRTFGGKNLYKSSLQLFGGKAHSQDLIIIKKLLIEFKELKKNYDEILIPFGVGDHIDHLIVKFCAEKVFPKNIIRYYADQPYALKITNWKKIKRIWKYRVIKISLTSAQKRLALLSYNTQIQLLFKKRFIFYPEIIFKKK